VADLTSEQVRSLAAALGLSITDDDLEDVTLRLNATLEHLTELDRVAQADVATASAHAHETAPRGPTTGAARRRARRDGA
jgi:Asp-tRNA(Asn)/Glu-tRNA(Gln) amidotransferase C subunit